MVDIPPPAIYLQLAQAETAPQPETPAEVEVPPTKVDVGRSLMAVAGLLSAAGKTDEAEATYRKAETLLADLARSSPPIPAARAALANCRTGMGRLRSNTGKFVDAFKQAFRNSQLIFQADLKLLAQPNIFAAWLRPLFREKWVVYLKPPFGGPAYVLQYLGRYTHRVAISNHRLVSFVDGQVTFRWRDSADGNKQKLLPLSVNEFLTRFLLHILPQGFVRIRNFGFLASRKRTTLLPLCFQLLGATQEPPAQEHASSTEDAPHLYPCPKCGGPMKIIERLTAAEIQLRSPPVVTAA